MNISDYSNSRDNNFNLIRLIAAWLVLFSHSYAIVYGGSEYEPLRWLGTSWGSVAVDVFFVTSGFLITKSFLSSDTLSFAFKRVMRIFPALVVAVMLMVITLSDDYTSREALKFIFKNTTLIFGVAHTLPDVYTDTPLGPAVNGSLWTLPWEIRCYIGVAVIATFKPKISLPVTAALATIAYLLTEPEFVRLIAMFFIGGTAFMYQDRIKLNHTLAAILGAALALSVMNPQIYKLVYLVALPYLVFYLSYIPKGKILSFNKVGDYSYGMYIYAFPVQQALTYVTRDISTHIALSTLITLTLAFFSWHVVEKQSINPALRGKLLAKTNYQ